MFKHVLLLSSVFAFLFSVCTGIGIASSFPGSCHEEPGGDSFFTNPTFGCADSLFPESFTSEQVQKMFSAQTIPVGLKQFKSVTGRVLSVSFGTLSADADFEAKVKPYSWQVITGTAASYAHRIKSLHINELKAGCLYGLYEYTKAYSSEKILYSVMLSPDKSCKFYGLDKFEGSCKIFNMRQSVLGNADFISTKTQLDPSQLLLPEVCLYYLASLNRESINKTEKLSSLETDTKNWLLVEHCLKGGGVPVRSLEKRKFLAEQLLQHLLEDTGNNLQMMTHDKYADCLLLLRLNILALLGIYENEIPSIPGEEMAALCEGKIFFVVGDKSIREAHVLSASVIKSH